MYVYICGLARLLSAKSLDIYLNLTFSEPRGSWLGLLGPHLDLKVLYYACVHMWTSLVVICKVFGYVLVSDPSKPRGSSLGLFLPELDLKVLYYVCVHMWISSVDIFILFGNAQGFNPLETKRALVEDAWTRFELDCGVLCM